LLSLLSHSVKLQEAMKEMWKYESSKYSHRHWGKQVPLKTRTRGIANKKRESYPTDQHGQCITEETKNDILHLSVNSQLLFKPHSYCSYIYIYIYTQSVTCGYVPHRGNIALLQIFATFLFPTDSVKGAAVAQWLRYCATNRKDIVAIPDGVTGFFRLHNPSNRISVLGSTQPLTEMSTRSMCWG
jgi:hypothetical protein